jgi:hypothetical protein
MEFVNLSRRVLVNLKKKGYTTLHSISGLDNENPTWIPYRDNIETLMELDNDFIAKISFPFDEKHFIVIDDALKNIEESNLIGQVFMSDI